MLTINKKTMNKFKLIAQKEAELESLKVEAFDTTNTNTWGTISEFQFAEYMTAKTGNYHECLGGNTKGYDVIDTVNGTTYEIKSTRTTKKSYHYGGLVDKTADYAVFIKWDYSKLYTIEYCYLLEMNDVKSNLSPNYNRMRSTRLKELTKVINDITLDFSNYIEAS